jgi:DNA processing protein
MSRAWLTLALTPGLNAAALMALLRRFGDADAICAAGARGLQDAGLASAIAEAVSRPAPEPIESALAWLGQSSGHHLVAFDDPAYPALLREIPDAPIALFVRGSPACLGEPQIAIVGSRNASAGGEETAFEFARYLGHCGLSITSGLALGIDAAAHRGALSAAARSIAVLGTGADAVYPSRHGGLATEIAAAGALVSEFPPGTPPRRANFPQRNRIISGLSVGVLVVEAGTQSGALVTAGFARDQGREVFAIPGSIHNPLAKGCHRLIRQGAKLVESAADVLEELPELLSVGRADKAQHAGIAATRAGRDDAAAQAAAEDPEYRRLLDAMGWDTVDTDTAARRSGLTAAEVSSMLLILELQGKVDALAGGRYMRHGAAGRDAAGDLTPDRVESRR